MKNMDPMKIVDIRSEQEFAMFYNHNLETIDKVLRKLINTTNRQSRKIFSLSLMVCCLSGAVIGLASRQAKLEEKVDILQAKKEASEDEEK